MKHTVSILIAFLGLAINLPSAETGGQKEMPGETAADPAAQPAKKRPETAMEKPSVTRHSMTWRGEVLNYTATAGYMPIENESGKLQARLFYVAYTRNGVSDLDKRPVGFAFNGGPGASSVWLHIGGLGPKRVLLAADGTELPVSDRLLDNEQTWLGFTDLVFIDPVGTGFSRAAEGVDAKQFYDVRKDIDVTGEFVRLYITENGRWLSPKFVIGESYGTTRAAGLASHLQHSPGLNLAGVILLSSALSFQTFETGGGNDLPYALALPTFTAVASYHKKLPRQTPAELEHVLVKVEHWALDGYTSALAKGDTLTQSERCNLTEKLARCTGLSTNYLVASHWRVGAQRFTKELLRNENRTVGLLDGRVLGIDISRLGEYPQYDPAMFLTTGPFVSTFNDYLRRDLKFENTLKYELFSNEVNRSWKWDTGGQGYLYVGDNLAEAMSKDTRLRVFLGMGLYDLTTPYLSQKYTFDHLGLDPGLHGNFTFRLYPSGHQIYTDIPSLKKLEADAAAFIQEPRRP
ncbi:MAG: peptidase S10 [Candidatus Omnitrophica bacterium]|nr:peptidase S10 [Candidatus Omnitrophota bacterium]